MKFFIQALEDLNFGVKRYGGSMRCYMRDNGTPVAAIEFTVGRKGVQIDRLIVALEHRGNRYGSKILDRFCQAADESGTMLVLSPEPLVTSGVQSPLDAKALREWYARHGFVKLGKSWMGRNPQVLD